MSEPDGGLQGVRIADEGIYLAERRHAEPKETFKLLRALIAQRQPARGMSVLDVGCATGELLHYLGGEFPGLELHGIDVSPALIERAKAELPGAAFAVGTLEDGSATSAGAYDYCTLSGVLCCLDDPRPALGNVLTWLKPGGTAFVADSFNQDPIDVVMRYRRADNADASWETGWNIFAKASIDRFLKDDGRAEQWDYVPFLMPFALPRRDDPMRTWTIATERNPHQIVNGASQLVDLSVLVLRKRS